MATQTELLRAGLAVAIGFGFVVAQTLPAQPPASRTFNCFARAAETRVRSRAGFLLADSDASLRDQVFRLRRVVTVAAQRGNPQKADDGLIHDWIGTVFVPGIHLDRLIPVLQDYDRRAVYFSEILSSSKLLCRNGSHFRSEMRLKEPAPIDTENDVVWERVDAYRWKSTSYSTRVREAGGDHEYLLRLNSYWRFSEADEGVYVEAETLTLSGQFGAFLRTLGSVAGISPETSLKRSLDLIRRIAKSAVPAAIPDAFGTCEVVIQPPECPAGKSREH